MHLLRCSIYALLLLFLQQTGHLLSLQGCGVRPGGVISSLAAVASFGPQQTKRNENVCPLS